MRAELSAGKYSEERAKALHALGGNVYKQGRYEELLELSKEIVSIHEKLDGPESEKTAKALGNLGSVAYRVGNKKECAYAMDRALYIYLELFGEDSKEVCSLFCFCTICIYESLSK